MPNRKHLSVLIALLCALPSVSCGTVKRFVTPLVIPSSMLECADYPRVPAEGAPDPEIAVFIARTEWAWTDCRDTLAEVGELIEAQG